jgi:O-acetyl-ADP-ribose deacetylase (regulator of RNase III)
MTAFDPAMIQSTRGDLMEAQVDALVNPVNCVGVMGRGLALQFRQRFPAIFEAYRRACARGEVAPGKLYVHPTGRTDPRLVIHFPTKRHWRDPSLLEDIDAGLVDFVRVLQVEKVTSVGVPQLGCGLGGLDWAVVRPRIVAALEPLTGVRVLLFD